MNQKIFKPIMDRWLTAFPLSRLLSELFMARISFWRRRWRTAALESRDSKSIWSWSKSSINTPSSSDRLRTEIWMLKHLLKMYTNQCNFMNSEVTNLPAKYRGRVRLESLLFGRGNPMEGSSRKSEFNGESKPCPGLTIPLELAALLLLPLPFPDLHLLLSLGFPLLFLVAGFPFEAAIFGICLGVTVLEMQ